MHDYSAQTIECCNYKQLSDYILCSVIIQHTNMVSRAT